jgi:replicative DNA helicase
LAATTKPEAGVVIADVASEQRVLAICLTHGDLIADVRGQLTPEHFSDPFCRTVWEAICQVFDRTGKLSAVRVAERMRKSGVRDAADQLASMRALFVAPAELQPSVDMVLAAYERRRRAEDAKRLYHVAISEAELTEVQRVFSQVSLGWSVRYETCEGTTHDVLGDIYLEYDAAKQGQPLRKGVTTGLAAFDSLIGLLEFGSLCVLGGATSMGKTATALNLAAGIARRHGWVLFHSLEMKRHQAVSRLVQARALVTREDLDSGGRRTPNPEDVQRRIDAAFSELYTLPIYWCDKRGLTAAELCAHARKAKRDHPDLAAWFVDYLQLIPLPSDKGRTDAAKIGDNCRMLRDAAGDLNVPIVLLSQLNRRVAQRDEKEPQLSDLRDSGNIEEFADYVVFVYRPFYYDKNTDESDLRLKVAKNRISGRTGAVRLKLDNEHQRICSWEECHRRMEWLDDTPEGRRWWW